MKEHPARPKKAYLYISRNEHALKEKIEEIKKHIGSAVGSGTDLKVFDVEDRLSLEDLEGFVSSPSLFSERKIALIEHIEKAPAAFQKKAAEMIPEDSGIDAVLIFTAPNEKVNKTLMEKIREVGVVRKIRPPVTGDLLKWLDGKAASDGIGFTEDARFLLVENVNLDMNLLKSEYGKLFDYISSEEKKIIDKDAVRSLVSRVYSLKIFDLVDFLGERDKNRSLEALEDILNEDKDLKGLITLIHRMFKSMLYIKTDKGNGSVTDYLARNIHMPPYFIGKMVSKYIKFSKSYSKKEIIEIINMLSSFDIEFRKSIIGSSKLVKTIIARITDIKIQESTG